ncbi:MAG: metalloregulator ArsR/SmtB family transcription factor [Pseudomonadota bacterium]
MTNGSSSIDLTFAALADPTRRAIVSGLRGGARSVGDLAAGLPVSRPAVSQHLRVLTDAGLLSVEQQGTRRMYALIPQSVADLRRYLDNLWDDALAAYAAEARRQARAKTRSQKKETKS